MELLQNLLKFKKELEEKAKENGQKMRVMNISYYQSPKSNFIDEKESPIYLVEKDVEGKQKRELMIKDKVIADIKQDNSIQIRKEFLYQITSQDILIKLRDTIPVSLNELEKKEEQRKDNKGEKQGKKQTKAQDNPKDIEIDMDKPITKTKTFAQLVPEVKEKAIQQVKIRRMDMTRFEFYGIDENGYEIELDSIKMVEGANPNKQIKEINQDGSKVKNNQVLAIFQIQNGENEQAGNEGFTVDLADGTQITEVSYYRRDKDENEYTSIPVNLKNTNQKRTQQEVIEYAEKKLNTQVGDNIKRAEQILEKQDVTSIQNIDDNPYNDNSQTKEDYEEQLIKEAAKRCKISVEGFRKALENTKKEGEPIEDSIEKAEEEINEQVIGSDRMRN